MHANRQENGPRRRGAEPPAGKVRGACRIGAVAALATLTLISLAGCSSSPEPSNLETPDVVWPDGDPFGGFEDDPAVQAIAMFFTDVAIATNARDFSDPDLVNSIGVDRAQNYADSTGDDIWIHGPEKATALGPEPYLVLDVIPGDTGTFVVMCGYGARDMVDSRRLFSYDVTLRPGQPALVESTRDLPAEAKTKEEYGEQCGAAELPVGLFDPAPVPNMDPDAKVIGPADASKYDLD